MVVRSARLIVDTRNAIAGRHPHVLKLGAPSPALGPGAAVCGRESAWRNRYGLVVLDSCAIVAYVYVGLPGAADGVGAAAPAHGPSIRRSTARAGGVDCDCRAQRGPAAAGKRIDNLLQLEYPAAIARSSSSPTDRPTTRSTVLARYRRVNRCRARSRRAGKAAALNAGVARATARDPRLRRRAAGLRRRRPRRADGAVSRSARRRGDGRAAPRLRVSRPAAASIAATHSSTARARTSGRIGAPARIAA